MNIEKMVGEKQTSPASQDVRASQHASKSSSLLLSPLNILLL